MEDISNLIKDIISQTYPISMDTAKQLLNCTIRADYHKNDIIEKEQQKIRHEYIVLDGTIRFFLTNKKGEEFTIAFYNAPQPIAPSLFRSVNFYSFVNIQVISKSASILLFSIEEMQRTMQNNSDLERFGHFVMMAEAQRKVEREKILLMAEGYEKLAWLRKMYPNLENQIPHYYIASFLGLSPTSLSRLRKKIAQK